MSKLISMKQLPFCRPEDRAPGTSGKTQLACCDSQSEQAGGQESEARNFGPKFRALPHLCPFSRVIFVPPRTPAWGHRFLGLPGSECGATWTPGLAPPGD